LGLPWSQKFFFLLLNELEPRSGDGELRNSEGWFQKKEEKPLEPGTLELKGLSPLFTEKRMRERNRSKINCTGRHYIRTELMVEKSVEIAS